MEKAILVIDAPKSCADCRLRRGLFCGESGDSLYDYIRADESLNDKPSWCPLRPLPKRMPQNEYGNWHIIEDVWNACLDEILGEK